MARYDDLNTKMIGYAAVLSIVLLIIILQATQALSYNLLNTEDHRKAATKATHADLAKAEQIDSLNGYKKALIADEAAEPPKKGEEPKMKEIIQIPITEAQKLILKELSSAPAPAPGT